MPDDEFDALFDHVRMAIRAGADSITLGPVAMGDLLDQADHLADIYAHQLAFSAVTIANHLADRAAGERFLRETLGAHGADCERLTLAADGYVAELGWDGERWWWSPVAEAATR